jgi:hypothetical protein
VASCCECVDEPPGSCPTELVCLLQCILYAGESWFCSAREKHRLSVDCGLRNDYA